MRSLFALLLLIVPTLASADKAAYDKFRADVESFKGRTVQEYLEAHPNIQPMVVHAAKFDYYAFGSNNSYVLTQQRGTPAAPSYISQRVTATCTWGLVTDPGDATIKDVKFGKGCEALFGLD